MPIMTHGLFVDLIIKMIIKAMDSSSNINVVLLLKYLQTVII